MKDIDFGSRIKVQDGHMDVEDLKQSQVFERKVNVMGNLDRVV